MSFTYGGINTDDLEGVEVTPITYPNMGGLQLDIVETPGRDGRFYGGSRMTTSQLPFRVTISGETQQQADLRRLAFMRMLDPSTGARSLRLDNTANWHYPQAVVAQQIEWEKHADRSKVIYDGEVVFETNFDAAMRQIDPSTVSGVGQIEFVADMGSTVSYPTVIFESGGDIRVRVNDFIVDLYDTPPDTYGVLNWDEYKFYTADADLAQSILYEWEGEPHASPSVKSVGGEIVARNLVPNPRGANTGSEIVVVENFEGSVSPDPDLDLVGGNLVGLRPIGANISGSGGVVYWSESRNSFALYANGSGHASMLMSIPYSGSMAVRVDVFETTAVGSRTARARYSYAQSGWEDYTFPTVILNAETGGGSSFYFQVNDPDEGDVYYFTLHIAEADTEQDALAQVEHYFDGDYVGHIVPGERISSLVNSMSHFERPAIYPGDSVEVEVTPIGSNTATPVIVYPNHRRL